METTPLALMDKLRVDVPEAVFQNLNEHLLLAQARK